MQVLRSLLFVPGDSQRKLTRAAQIPADAVIVDWEDAVLTEQKASARALTVDFLQHAPARWPVFIRFNPAGTAAFEQDCETLRVWIPSGVVLSKCNSAQDVRKLQDVLDATDTCGTCCICPMVESPQGLLNVASIAADSPRVKMVAFGAEDFSVQMRITRTWDEIELLYARSAIVAACRAAGREAIDTPFLAFRDPEGLRTAVYRARNLGFSGKLAIHPDQVPAINEVFSPSEAEVREARQILEAMSSADSVVFAVEGRVVDEPVIKRARSILNLARERSPDRRD
jgi:citrate lyase subunit beta/citryl-CoA lyase